MAIATVQYPHGFTDILFVNDCPQEKGGSTFFLAKDFEAAKELADPDSPLYPMPHSDLMSGMKKAEKRLSKELLRPFLLSFGPEWVVREGILFFKRSKNGIQGDTCT